MSTYTWSGASSGSWDDAGNWGPPGGPPEPGDTAQVGVSAVIVGGGAASELDTSNQSGQVTLNGSFNIGTIFNGAEMTLAGNITSQFIETFVNLDITGDVAVNGDTSNTYEGIFQYNGTVDINNGGSVAASYYLLSYNPGSLDQPDVNAFTLDGSNGGAWLTINATPTVNASDQIVGGFAIAAAASVTVENSAVLSTPYLSLGISGAIMTVSDASIEVPVQIDEDGEEVPITDSGTNVAGINIDGGLLQVENAGTISSPFFAQAGSVLSGFILDASTATFDGDPNGFNGFTLDDGTAIVRNNATLSASGLNLGAPLDDDDTVGPQLAVMSSTVTITPSDDAPAGLFVGILLADGQTTITDDSIVSTPNLDAETDAFDGTAAVVAQIEGGSVVSVQDDVLLGQDGESDPNVVVSGGGTNLLFGGTLAVADDAGPVPGADGNLLVSDGAFVRSTGVPGGGVLVVGGAAGDDGSVTVDGTGADLFGDPLASELNVQNATIGEAGTGTLIASSGGSIDVSGTLVLGDATGSSSSLDLAGTNGAGQLSANTLVVGNQGSATVQFSSSDTAYSGTLIVYGNAFVGASGSGAGTIDAAGGSFTVDNDLVVGAGGIANVDLHSTTLSVTGNLAIGDGGISADLDLQDVTLTLGGQLDVGVDSPATLDWGSSAEQTTTVGTVILGAQDDGDGTFVLHDPTTDLTTGALTVGGQDGGTLDVYNGASIVVTGIADIAASFGAAGEIDVEFGTDSNGVAYPNSGSSIIFDQALYVGDGGDGSLYVGSDDTAGDTGNVQVNGNLIIGNQGSAAGFVSVSNANAAGASLSADGNIYVGNQATGGDNADGNFEPGGILQIVNGGTVEATQDGAGLIDVAAAADSTGGIDVNASELDANTLVIGDGGDGELKIENGDVAVEDDIIVGNSADATGTIDIDGGSTLENGGNLVIGGASTAIDENGTIAYPAVLDATNGAAVENGGTGVSTFIIGANANSLGEAIFNAATLDVDGASIGDDGSGVLEIENNSTATFGDDLLLGGGASAFGGMDVNASYVEFDAALDVGEDATGATIGGTFIPGAVLTIENSSTVTGQGSDGIDVGADPGSTGSVTIDNSVVDAAGVTVGDDGTGVLILQDSGTLLTDEGEILEVGGGTGASGTVVVNASTLIAGSDILLGNEGSGLLIDQNGGTIIPAGSQPPSVTLGEVAGASGTLVVDNSVFNTSSIVVGANGTGTLYVQDGGTITTTGGMTIGAADGSAGTVAVIGVGGGANATLLQIAGSLLVGDSGAASLQVSNGATVTVAGTLDAGGTGALLGDDGSGSVLVTDGGSLLQAQNALVIGAGGTATVSVVSGASLVAAAGLVLGQSGNADGTLAISFTSAFINGGSVVVGAQGAGEVEVNGGATFNAGSLATTLGSATGASGTLGLGDALGSSIAQTGALVIGAAGSGTVTVHAGSQLSTKGNAVIGNTGTGTVLVEGNNGGSPATPSTWTIAGNLLIGGTTTAGGGTGTLTVQNGGAVRVAGDVTMWSHGTVVDNGSAPGLIEIGGTTASGTLTGIVVDAAIAATGSTTATPAGTLVGGGTIEANILDNGLVEAANKQTLTVAGNVTGAGTLALGGTAALLLQGSVAATTAIAFKNVGTAVEVLALADPLAVAGTIDGIGRGDAIDLPGVPHAGTDFSVSGTLLTVTNSGGTVAALTLGGTYTTSQFSLAEDGSGNAEIVYGNALPNVSKPKLNLPVALSGYIPITGYASNGLLAGPLGVFLSDPNPPPFATYALTLTAQKGSFEFYPDAQIRQSGSTLDLSGSLTQLNADLSYLVYSPPANVAGVTPPDTIDVTLTRGDGVTVSGAIGLDPIKPDPQAIYTGPTSVALGQSIPLSFILTDPLFAGPGGGDGRNWQLSTNGTGIVLVRYLDTRGGVVSNPGTIVAGGGSSADMNAQLAAGNLTYVPTTVGDNTLTFQFEDVNLFSANLTVTIDVTPNTEITPATDTWTGAASATLDAADNWNLGAAPQTGDIAVFAPIAGVPVIATTGNGVAGAWDIDASTSFDGIIDATGVTGSPAVAIDQGATATFLDQAGLIAAGVLIVGDTTPSALVFAWNDNPSDLSNADEADGSLETDDTTIANQPGAGGSEMVVSGIDWADAGSIVVGGSAYGKLDLTDADLNAADGVQIGAGGGVLGDVVSLYTSIDGDMLVGAGGNGELAIGGGNASSFFDPALVEGPAGESGSDGSTLLSIVNGSRVDLAAGNEIALGENQAIYIDYGAMLTGDGTIEQIGGPDNFDTGSVILNGTIEAVDATAAGPLLIAANIYGSGSLLIDAGAILSVGSYYEAPGNVQAGTTVDFLPAYDAAGGMLSIGAGDTMAATIIGFGADDRIALGASGIALESATFSAGSDTTNVVFNMGTAGTTLTFAGSLVAGNFVLDPDQPGNTTVFDFTDPNPADQTLLLAGPTDIATTDGVATPIPGLSLSDAAAGSTDQLVTLTFTAQNGGSFSGVDSTGAAIAGSGSGTLTISGVLAAVQGDLPAITFTPATGSDDTITVSATDGSTVAPATLTVATHDSSEDDPDFAGTNNYVYAGPGTGSFDLAGSWQYETGSAFASAPGIADSATIEASPSAGVDDVLGGFGLTGQLLTIGDVVLTGTMELAGLSAAGIGTPGESGPAFSGALDATQGILILGAGSELTAGGDVLVDGELDLLSDNAATISGNIVVRGGTLRLGGLGTVTADNAAAGAIDIGSTIETSGSVSPGQLDIESGLLLSTNGTIGSTTAGGTSVVDIGPGVWTLDGVLDVGGSGDGLLTLEDRSSSTGPELTAQDIEIGTSAGVTGTVLVNAANSLAAGDSLVIGAAGSGTLIADGGGGGDVTVGSNALPGELDIAAYAGSTGLLLTDYESLVTVDGSAYVGGSSNGAGGAGTLDIVADGGSPVLAVSGSLTVYGQGQVAVLDGTLSAEAITISPGGTASGDGLIMGVVTGDGLDVPIADQPPIGAPIATIIDDGLIEATVDPANNQSALTLYGDVSGTGTLAIAAGATLDVEGSVAASVDVAFLGTGGVLTLSDPGDFDATINGVVTGDEIHLPGIAPGTLSYTPATGVLTDTVAGQVYSFTFDPPAGTFGAASDSHDGSDLTFTGETGAPAPGEITLGTAAVNVALPGSTEVASFSDTNLDDTASAFSATIDWGDGTITAGTVSGGDGSFMVDGGHSYATAGDVTVGVTITDTSDDSVLPLSGTVVVNGLPMIAVPGGQTLQAGQAAAISGVSVSETGNTGAPETFTTVLTDNNGLLSVTPSGAASVTGGDSTSVTISGSLTDVNNTLKSLFDTDAIAGFDTITATATDSFGNAATAEVIPLVVNGLPAIGGTQADQGVPSGSSDTPFAGVAITDANPGATETVTVTLSDPSGGALAGSAGRYNPTTGVYSVSGTPLQVTGDLDALVFTPAAVPGTNLSTTGFTIDVTGPGGSVGDSSTSVTWVKQVEELAAIPSSDIAISVSPDGSRFAPATSGKTNEAVVLDPAQGGTYVLPSGYQAEFLGGSAALDPTLSDPSGGNALLVGNSGIDTISVGAANDTVLAGGGSTTTIEFSSSAVDGLAFSGMDSFVTIAAAGNADTVAALGAATGAITTTGSDALVLGGVGSITAAVEGSMTTVAGGSGTLSATIGGSASGAVVLGGSGALSIDDQGSGATIAAFGASAAAVTTSGADALVFGGMDTLTAAIAGSGATLVGGVGTTEATIGGSAVGVAVFGGSGALSIDDQGNGATIAAFGASSVAVTTSGSDALVFGGADTLAALIAGSGATLVGGSGTTGATIGGGAAGVAVFGGGGALSIDDQGSGATIAAFGASSAAVTTSGSDALVFGGSSALTASIAGSGATLAGGSGTTDATIGGSASGVAVLGGTGALSVDDQGSGDTIAAFGTNSAIVTVSGNSDLVFAGGGPSTIDAGGSDTTDTIVAGSRPLALTAAGSDVGLLVFASSGNLNFVGGTGGATIVSGTGSATISGGGAGTTLFGTAGSDITYGGSAGSLDYRAGTGSETLEAGSSTTDDVLAGGQGTSSSDLIVAGQGNDTLLAGSGLGTLTGGASSDDWFVFLQVNGGVSAQDTVSNFTANDTVYLAGYGAGAAAAATIGASSNNGSTTLTLADHTTITFTDIAGATALQGHIISS